MRNCPLAIDYVARPVASFYVGKRPLLACRPYLESYALMIGNIRKHLQLLTFIKVKPNHSIKIYIGPPSVPYVSISMSRLKLLSPLPSNA